MPGDPLETVPASDRTETTSPASRATEAELATYRYFSSEFDQQLKAQTTNVLISGGFCLAVVVIGLIGTILLYRTAGVGGSAIEYMKLGPVALSGISLPFPLRAYLQYRVRRPIYQGYKRLFDQAIATKQRVEPYLIEDARSALKSLHKMD